jgi:hypothetical protein
MKFQPLMVVIGYVIVFGTVIGTGASQARTIIGVNVHNGGGETRLGYEVTTELRQLHDLGLTSVRDGVLQAFFLQRDAQHPLGPVYEKLNQVLDGLPGPSMLIVQGNPPKAMGDKPAVKQAYLNDFTNFAGAFAEATKTHKAYYEVWNEWNVQAQVKPDSKDKNAADPVLYSPENYVEIARAAYSGIKRANADAPVIVGAIGQDANWAWTRQALRAGLLKTADGISVHLYNYCTAPDQRNANELIAKATEFRDVVRAGNGGKDFPVYITEVGWPTMIDGACGFSLADASRNAVEFITWARRQPWIKGVWIYELKDGGTNSADAEDNFGLYLHDDKPKPAVPAIAKAAAD